MHSSNKWIRNAGDDANKLVYGKHHNDTWASPYGLARSASFGIRLALGDPSLWIGLTVATLDLTLGNIINAIRGDPMAFVQYRHGGYVVRNSAIARIGGSDSAIVLAPFAFVGENIEPGTLQHEMAHIDQYNQWGGMGLFRPDMAESVPKLPRRIRGQRGKGCRQKGGDGNIHGRSGQSKELRHTLRLSCPLRK